MPRRRVGQDARANLKPGAHTTTTLAEITASALDLRWNLDPVEATGQGIADYDDRYGNFTEADVNAHIAALRSVAGTLEAVDAEDLDDEIDRTALLGDVRVAINRFKKEKPHVRNPNLWLSHVVEGLYILMVRPPADEKRRQEALLSRIEDIPRFLTEARETLRECPRVFVETALQVAPAATELLRSAGELVESDDSERTDAAVKAIEDFSSFLRDALDDEQEHEFAIGEDAFNFRLHFEHALRATAPEIYRWGMRFIDEVEADICDRVRAIGHRGPWQDMVSQLREDHPDTGDLVSAYRSELERCYEFVAERNLVFLPTDPVDVIETPPFLRPLVPYAAYQSPGAFSEQRRGMFFVSVPEDGLAGESEPLREHCYYDLPITTLHEAYPGHHLQLLHAQSQERLVRKVIGTPLTIEGWALYCEEMMGEEGFYRSEEERIFQKVQLLWRAVRVVVDVALHTRNMTPDEASDMLVERAGLERSNADAEVRRYCAYPAYQLCYAVGRREILDLRTAYEAARGADYNLREFHDGLMSYGSLPVNLIRWGMGLD